MDWTDGHDDGAILFLEDENCNLETGVVYSYLSNISESDKLSTCPPVQPVGGTVYLFNLGSNSSKWDLKKKQFRYN